MHWCAPAAPDVDGNKEEEPDDIHKMPVPGCCLKSEMLLRRKVALVRTRETDRQEDRTYNDVKAVKAGRHVEGRAVIQPTKWKWCDGIFVRLNSAEQHPEKDGQP